MEYTYNAPEIRPKCGEIWMCDLPFREGDVQYGKRPVFVLSNDLNNTYSRIVNIIECGAIPLALPRGYKPLFLKFLLTLLY